VTALTNTKKLTVTPGTHYPCSGPVNTGCEHG